MTILTDPGGERLFLEGRLEGVGVPDLIHAVCLPQRTGTLTFLRGDVSKTIYVKDGHLIFASSTVAHERLGETLLRSGVIGYRQLEEAVEQLGNGKRLGTILVELGHLAPSNLVRGLLHQVKEIILSLFPWDTGAYRFVEGPLPTAEVIVLNISTPKIISDGIQRISVWPKIARNVGRSHAVYRLTKEGRLLAEELDLGPAERVLLDTLEKPVTVGEVCTSVFLPNFDVYQHLWAFKILGIVSKVEDRRAAPREPVRAGNQQGVLEQAGFGPLLLTLTEQKQTGVLCLTREGEEKSVHLRQGEVVFATSNRPDDSLTTFLLRRGVIGLHDKEEIERRLLSNKRPGTILREMGILSQEELVRFVREQLEDIVVAIFGWEAGEWRFFAGDLPTFEEITLDVPSSDLVFKGVRVVADLSAVRAGCGGLSTILQPVDDVLARLAASSLGTDEQEVIAALASCRTVGGVCESTQVSDYRAGQILWALQMLGAVRRVGGLGGDETPIVSASGPGREVGEEVHSNAASPGAASSGAASPASAMPSSPMPDSTSTGGTTPIAADADQRSNALAGQDEEPTLIPLSSASDIGGRTDSGSEGRVPGGTEPGERARPARAPVADAAIWLVDTLRRRSGADLTPSPEDRSQEASGSLERSLYDEVETHGGPISSADRTETPAPGTPPDSRTDAAAPSSEKSDYTSAAEGREGAADHDDHMAAPGPGAVPPHDSAAPTEAGTEAELDEDARRRAEKEWQESWNCQNQDMTASDASPLDAGTNSASPTWGSGWNRAPRPDAHTRRKEPSQQDHPHAFPQEPDLRPHREDRPSSPAPTVEAPSHTALEAVGTGVLEEIERFNRRHREVYSVLRGAVGAGAKNFVSTCVRRLDEESSVFAALPLDETGAFSASELYARIGGLAPAAIRRKLEALITAEVDFARAFLDERTVQHMFKRVEAVTSEVGAERV